MLVGGTVAPLIPRQKHSAENEQCRDKIYANGRIIIFKCVAVVVVETRGSKRGRKVAGVIREIRD